MASSAETSRAVLSRDRHNAENVGACNVQACSFGVTLSGRIGKHDVMVIDLGGSSVRLCEHRLSQVSASRKDH
jgi:hypothetical protein